MTDIQVLPPENDKSRAFFEALPDPERANMRDAAAIFRQVSIALNAAAEGDAGTWHAIVGRLRNIRGKESPFIAGLDQGLRLAAHFTLNQSAPNEVAIQLLEILSSAIRENLKGLEPWEPS